jgi:transcriptional regulator with XRE-family HTH domain
MDIGTLIKYTREQKSISLDTLASKLQLSKSYLEKVEDGRIDPTFGSINRILASLETSFEQIYKTRTVTKEVEVIKYKYGKLGDVLDYLKKIHSKIDTLNNQISDHPRIEKVLDNPTFNNEFLFKYAVLNAYLHFKMNFEELPKEIDKRIKHLSNLK